MKISPFRLERFFAKYEFNTPHLLCCSDCETVTVADLLAMEPEAESQLKDMALGYTETSGHPELRREIAKLYYQTEPEQVLVHAGAEEAIFTVMNALLEPNDHILVHCPTYQSLFEVAKSIGCRVTKWEATEEANWELDLDALQEHLQSNLKAVVINCPNNPTGYVMSRDKQCMIVELAREHDFIVISDEVYAFSEHDPQNRLPAACDILEQAVSIGAMSKSFGMPGLRIAWTASRDPSLLAKIASFKDYTTICNSAPSEFLAALALRHKTEILARNQSIIKDNLARLNSFFANLTSHFDWRPPKAGPIAFPSLRNGQSAQEFCSRLVQECGVLLLPGTIYDDRYTHNFRIGFGRRDMSDGLEQLQDFIARR